MNIQWTLGVVLPDGNGKPMPKTVYKTPEHANSKMIVGVKCTRKKLDSGNPSTTQSMTHGISVLGCFFCNNYI